MYSYGETAISIPNFSIFPPLFIRAGFSRMYTCICSEKHVSGTNSSEKYGFSDDHCDFFIADYILKGLHFFLFPQSHMTLHTGKKFYSCTLPDCTSSFNRRSHLQVKYQITFLELISCHFNWYSCTKVRINTSARCVARHFTPNNSWRYVYTIDYQLCRYYKSYIFQCFLWKNNLTEFSRAQSCRNPTRGIQLCSLGSCEQRS